MAYVVTSHFGIDTSDYSFGYVAGWSSGKEIKELKQSLDKIQKEASKIIIEMEEYLKELEISKTEKLEQSTNNISKIVVPEDRTRIEKQIKALEAVLKCNLNTKDRAIHTQALKDLKKELKVLDNKSRASLESRIQDIQDAKKSEGSVSKNNKVKAKEIAR